MSSSLKYAIRNPKKAARYALHRLPTSQGQIRDAAHWFYLRARYPRYERFYAELQDRKIRSGYFYDESESDKGQFEFLRRHGLEPHHALLDIGCGTLRGGRNFIDFLDAENYYGMDISGEALNTARRVVKTEDLEEKSPTLRQNSDLTFSEFSQEFDYLLAQSVLTHLPEKAIRECFDHASDVMHAESVFLASFQEGDEYRFTPSFTIENSHSTRYSFEELAAVAREYGLAAEYDAYPEHVSDIMKMCVLTQE